MIKCCLSNLCIPALANYLAQDANGSVWGFECTPLSEDESGGWVKTGGYGFLVLSRESVLVSPNPRWRDSLVDLQTPGTFHMDGHDHLVHENASLKRHIHADLMIAAAEDISLRFEWRVGGGSDWVPCSKRMPSWHPETSYRIKPKAVKYLLYVGTTGELKLHTGTGGVGSVPSGTIVQGWRDVELPQ